MATARRSSPTVRPRAVRQLVTGALAVGLAGCSATNAVTTNLDYSPTDGVDIVAGEVHAVAVLILTSDEGAPGTMLGGVTNRGEDPAVATITMAGSDEVLAELELGRDQTVTIGPDQDETVEIESVPAPPGALVEVTLTSATGGSATARVPVLDDTLEQYSGLVPSSDG